MNDDAKLPSDRWPMTRLVWLAVLAAAVGQPFHSTSGCNERHEVRLSETRDLLWCLAFLLAATVLPPLVASLFRGSVVVRQVTLAVAIMTGLVGVALVFVAGYVSLLSKTTPHEGAHLAMLSMSGATLENVLRVIANRLGAPLRQGQDPALLDEAKRFRPWYRRLG